MTFSAAMNSGVSSILSRIHRPTGPTSRPKKKGTRQAQLLSCSGERKTFMLKPNAEASSIAAPWVATCQEA